MPHAEREAATSLITTLIVIVLISVRISGQYAEGAFQAPGALQTWARSVLILVAISIAIALGVTILAAILHGILTATDTSDDQRDERDVQIERRAMQIAMDLLAFGILLAIIDLALGATAFRAVNLILAACAASEVCKDAFKLCFYRRGF